MVSELFAGSRSGLTMNTQAFGCSPLSVQNTESDYLFGRNFDGNTCDTLVVTSYPQDGYASISTVNLTIADKPSMTQVEVRDALDSVSKDNFGEFESTEWSIVFEQSALTAAYYHRENYKEVYLFQITGE